MTRVSLIGEVQPIEADPLLVSRYLRYHPHAERFLMLGDFRFHRFEPIRVLTVGGFAKASWLEGERLQEAPTCHWSMNLNSSCTLLNCSTMDSECLVSMPTVQICSQATVGAVSDSVSGR